MIRNRVIGVKKEANLKQRISIFYLILSHWPLVLPFLINAHTYTSNLYNIFVLTQSLGHYLGVGHSHTHTRVYQAYPLMWQKFEMACFPRLIFLIHFKMAEIFKKLNILSPRNCDVYLLLQVVLGEVSSEILFRNTTCNINWIYKSSQKTD